MRKKKELIDRHKPSRDEPLPGEEALESEVEQRYEEIDGETSTDGVGPGFDSAEDDESPSTADGPMAGESSDPPMDADEGRVTGRSSRGKKTVRGTLRGNHIAAHSSRQI